MKYITEPPWRVAHALDLDPDERHLAGLIVISGPPRAGTLVADCRSEGMPLHEQRANAVLCAKAPALAQALVDLEDQLGDLPAGRAADALYSLVVKALRSLSVQPRRDSEDA